MHPALTQALQPVLRDIAATGVPMPAIEDRGWDPSAGTASAMLRSPDGSGSGISIVLDSSEIESIVRVADQVQEWVIEELWSSGTNWPACLLHPTTHPMIADATSPPARWRCPLDGSGWQVIGELARTGRQ